MALCTEATGYVHGTTLRWALARDGRLPFNANLRLFTTAGRWYSPSGLLVNVLFIITLVLSYAAGSAIVLRNESPNADAGSYTHLSIISVVPPIFLGSALVVQAVLGFISLYATDVVSWSTNPLDVAAAHYYHRLVQHRPDRCMRSIADAPDSSSHPVLPSKLQPSAAASHGLVRKVIWLVWTIPGVTIIVAILLMARQGSISIWWGGFAPRGGIVWASLLIGVFQSVLTMGLHCCELVTTLSRDEAVWRSATTRKGAVRTSNPIMRVIGSWQSIGLLIAKPLIHFLYGQAITMRVDLGLLFDGIGMLALSGGWIAVAAFVTFVAKRRPKGPQPAAYGHLQTMVDLVDDWSATEVMWWGHKKSGPVCHAGTSDSPLPEISIHEVYA